VSIVANIVLAFNNIIMTEIKDDGALERLKDFFAEQMERTIERDMMMAEAQRTAIEEYAPSAGQVANVAGMFAPGMGLLDYYKGLPALPAHDQSLTEAFSGERSLSAAENWERGNYPAWLLQALGFLGDATYAAGPLVGVTLGSILKAPGVTRNLAKAALSAKKDVVAKYAASNPKAFSKIQKQVGKNNIEKQYAKVRAKQGASEKFNQDRVELKNRPKKKPLFLHDRSKTQDILNELGFRHKGASFSENFETGLPGSLSSYYEHPVTKASVRVSDHAPVYPRSYSNVMIHPDSFSSDLEIEQALRSAAQSARQVGKGVKAGKGIASLQRPIDNYPLAPIDNWYSGADFQQRGGNLVNMTPDTFLDSASPLKIDDLARENIDELKRHILDGGELDPLELFSGDRALTRSSDGRHRAIAAKELGLDEIPVLDFRAAEIDRGIGALPRAGATMTAGSVPNRLNYTPYMGEIGKDPLPKHMREIETRFADQLNSDVDGAIEQYKNLPDSDGGRIISVDIARELSPDYVADRSLSAAVHEPSSAFIKEHYARMLKSEVPPDKFNEVLFTAGGTGAGKSTALADALLDKTVKSHLVYDGNLAGYSSSKGKIQQALDTGKDVTIAYVHRHPIEALTGGALPRATKQGRTVPIDAHASTHVRSIETVKDLAKHYDGNPNVDIRVIDNTRGKGNALDAGNDLSGLPEYDYNELLQEATDELNKALKEGKISQKVYDGFIGS